MFRTRDWFLDKVAVRNSHARIDQTNGDYSPFLNNLESPYYRYTFDYSDINSGLVSNSPQWGPRFKVSGLQPNQTVRFKAVLTYSAPTSGLIIIYRKNTNNYKGLGINQYSSETFSNDDTIQLGVYKVGASVVGSFTFYLANSIDGLKCSGELTFKTTDFTSGPINPN